MARRLPRTEPLPAAGLPRHRAVVALDIERSTSRPDPVKAELRATLYEVFDAALLEAGIRRQYRDRFIDRGDGILALIHPVDQAPKAALLQTAIPALSQLLADYNASLPRASRAQWEWVCGGGRIGGWAGQVDRMVDRASAAQVRPAGDAVPPA